MEVDVFHLPAFIQASKDERPYYPYMVLWADSGGPVLHFDLFEPEAGAPLQHGGFFPGRSARGKQEGGRGGSGRYLNSYTPGVVGIVNASVP